MTQSLLYGRRGRVECLGASWRGIGAALLFLTATAAFAQASGSPPPDAPFGDARVRTQAVPTVPSGSAGSPGSTEKQTEGPQDQQQKPPVVLVDEAPYRGWKHHVVRRPEDAIVLVRYSGSTSTGTSEATVTGLVVRCDGFLLVPRAVRDALRNSAAGAHGEAIITPADTEEEQEKQPAAPTVSASPITVSVHPHPGAHPTVGYALIKTTGYHVPCLPVLNSANVVSGMPVTVLTAVPTAGSAAPTTAPAAFTVVSRKAVVGRAGAERDTFLLDGVEAVKGQPAAIPAGSIVIDRQSGAAVGVIPEEQSGPGAMPVFTTFARLNVIADEIAVAPDRSAVRLTDAHGDTPGGPAPAGMVWVPGGAVRLTGPSSTSFRHDYQTDVACTPGFYAGIYPVTRQEYGDWLASKAIRNLPLQPYSYRLRSLQPRPDCPASGMTIIDALRYAGEHQERLLTETEWQRASVVTSVAWAKEKDRLANEATLKVYQAMLRASEVAGQQAEAAWADNVARDNAQRRFHTNGTTGNAIVDREDKSIANAVFFLPGDSDFDSLFNAVDAAQRQEKWPWRFVHPVGLFPEDISVFGLCDVVTNPREFLQNTGTGGVYGEKAAAAEIDPDYTSMFETSSGFSSAVGFDPNARSFGAAEAWFKWGMADAIFQILLWHDGWSLNQTGGDGLAGSTILSKTGLTRMNGFVTMPVQSGDSGMQTGVETEDRGGLRPTDAQQFSGGAGTMYARGVAVTHLNATAVGEAFPIFRCAR